MEKIITEPEILHRISRPTTWEEVKILDLKRRLRKSLKTGWTKGYGIAAIQIGIPVRFAFYKLNGKEYLMLNPEIVKQDVKRTHRREGCLSVPNIRLDIERYYYVEYRNDGGKKIRVRDLHALIVQHEIDHMDGILITDKGA